MIDELERWPGEWQRSDPEQDLKGQGFEKPRLRSVNSLEGDFEKA
jgi:hypothetical protein